MDNRRYVTDDARFLTGADGELCGVGSREGHVRLHSDRSRSTYIVEVAIMLACVILAVAVTMAAFSCAARIAVHADRQQHAMMLAANAAECFAADPNGCLVGSPDIWEDGGYRVECSTSAVQTDAGRMYSAVIAVAYDGEHLWTLETSRYVSGREEGSS